MHKARLRLHKPPVRRWWQRDVTRQRAEFYAALYPAAAAATQARLAEGAPDSGCGRDGTVAVKARPTPPSPRGGGGVLGKHTTDASHPGLHVHKTAAITCGTQSRVS